GCERKCAAADHSGPRTVGAHAKGDAVRIPVDELHLSGIEPELLVQDLLERRLVALTLGFGAHEKRGRTAGGEEHLGRRPARSRRPLDGIDDPKTTQLAASL